MRSAIWVSAARFYNGRPYGEMYEVTGLNAARDRAGQAVDRPQGSASTSPGSKGATCCPIASRYFRATSTLRCAAQGVSVQAGDVVLAAHRVGEFVDGRQRSLRRGRARRGLGRRTLADRSARVAGAAPTTGRLRYGHPQIRTTCLSSTSICSPRPAPTSSKTSTPPTAARRVSEFLFLLTPAKTRGSTACMAGPVAVSDVSLEEPAALTGADRILVSTRRSRFSTCSPRTSKGFGSSISNGGRDSPPHRASTARHAHRASVCRPRWSRPLPTCHAVYELGDAGARRIIGTRRAFDELEGLRTSWT